jgi:hypothetical protein
MADRRHIVLPSIVIVDPDCHDLLSIALKSSSQLAFRRMVSMSSFTGCSPSDRPGGTMPAQ